VYAASRLHENNKIKGKRSRQKGKEQESQYVKYSASMVFPPFYWVLKKGKEIEKKEKVWISQHCWPSF